jgi:hypothetical protein
LVNVSARQVPLPTLAQSAAPAVTAPVAARAIKDDPEDRREVDAI